MQEHVTCDLCGSYNYAVVWDKDSHPPRGITIRDGDTHYNARTVVCLDCGLLYVTPRMTRERLGSFYRDEYRKLYPKAPKAEKRHAESAYRVLRQLAAKDTRFLDVGAGSGLLVAKMSEYCHAEGIEPHGTGEGVRNVPLEEFTPEAPYDLVSMLNTLEHVPSPTEALTRLRRLLADSGRLLVSVPHVYTRLVNLPTDVFLSSAHLYHFSADTLHRLMLKVGLHPEKIWLEDEEIGEKLYVLAKKGKPTLTGNPQSIDGAAIRTRFLLMDRTYDLKMMVASWGFR